MKKVSLIFIACVLLFRSNIFCENIDLTNISFVIDGASFETNSIEIPKEITNETKIQVKFKLSSAADLNGVSLIVTEKYKADKVDISTESVFRLSQYPSGRDFQIGNQIWKMKNVEYSVHLKIEKKIGETTEIFGETTNEFTIKKYGFFSKLHSNLIFVRSSHKKNWEPSFASSYVLGINVNKNKIRSKTTKALASIWNAINMQFGVNLGLLNFDDDKSFEVGIGPNLCFLDGFFHIGLGWNISTERTRSRYAYIGFNLGEFVKFISDQVVKNKEE